MSGQLYNVSSSRKCACIKCMKILIQSYNFNMWLAFYNILHKSFSKNTNHQLKCNKYCYKGKNCSYVNS